MFALTLHDGTRFVCKGSGPALEAQLSTLSNYDLSLASKAGWQDIGGPGRAVWQAAVGVQLARAFEADQRDGYVASKLWTDENAARYAFLIDPDPPCAVTP